MTHYRAVFQVSEADAGYHEQVLRNVRNTATDLGEDAEVAVVTHGPGLQLTTGATGWADEVAQLVDSGIEVLACRNTMQRLGIEPDKLLPGVTMVDAGIGEIVRRQQGGWAYVRP